MSRVSNTLPPSRHVSTKVTAKEKHAIYKATADLIARLVEREPIKGTDINDIARFNALVDRTLKASVKQKREIVLSAAHILNGLCYGADISEKDRNVFWAFMNTLPHNDFTSVIN